MSSFLLDRETRKAPFRLLIIVWLGIIGFGRYAEAQQPPANAEPYLEPLSNEALVNVTIQTRITPHFEIYNPHSREDMLAIKNMGFTQVILDRADLHVEATRVGLNIVLANWWTRETIPEDIEQGIKYAAQVDRSRLVAVSMMDEPERHAPDTPFPFYKALYRVLRTRFDREMPGVQLEISHWGPLESWPLEAYRLFKPLYQATDRIRLMPYPDLYEGPLSEVYFQMQRSRHIMQLAGRNLPQVVILQTWALPNDTKLPTIEELRVMAYQAMLVGADTLSFYNYDPSLWQQTPGFTEEFAKLMQELTRFSHTFRTASVQSQMGTDGILKATIDLPGQAPVLVTVNTNRQQIGDLDPLAVVFFQAPSAAQPTDLCRSKVKRRIFHRLRCGFGGRRMRRR
jgi:hypothetical protein